MHNEAAGGGFPPDSTPCITVDGKTQYMGIDAVSPKQFKEMGGNFINLAPPGAASAQAGIETLVKNAALPAIGTAVRDAKEAAVRLPRTDASLSNVGTILRQPVDSVGRLHAAEVNRCSTPGTSPPPPPHHC